MIRQDGNGNNRRTGRSNQGRQLSEREQADRTAQFNPAYIPAILMGLDYFTNQGGPNQTGTQTTTQQNLPSWAIPDATRTLGFGNYFTNNPNYAPSTLRADFSNVRGMNPDGTPVSGVSQSGLTGYPTPPSAPPSAPPGANLDGTTPYDRSDIDNLVSVLSPDLQMQNMGPDSFRRGRQYGTSPGPSSGQGQSYTPVGGGGDSYEVYDQSTNPASGLTDPVGEGFLIPSGGGETETTTVRQSGNEGRPNPMMNPDDIFNPNMMTPFSPYDRQRFAGPGQETLRGEGILSGRYDQRFGTGGIDPFAAANQAVGSAANYQSGFQGTTGGIGGQAGNFQQGLGSARNPNVFRSQNYMNQTQGYENPNQGMQAQNYARDFRQNLNQFQDPYTDQVVNQTIKDMDRARQMTANQISGDAAKAGAFGGSRSMLMQAENNRNFADRTAAAVGQLRSQGFQKAADRAQQEQLQRLGLSASDIQNVRGLQSQGALAALGQRGQDFRTALGQTAAGDRAAMGYNAGLLSDAMGLDARDLQQRRGIASQEAQFAESANRGAGALNLQGGQALGQLAQAGTADERQRIADMLASGGAQMGRNQQDLDFIRSEFDRELQFPGQQIDLRNRAISPATNSVVTQSSPLYGQNPLMSAIGTGMTAYGLLNDPYGFYRRG